MILSYVFLLCVCVESLCFNAEKQRVLKKNQTKIKKQKTKTKTKKKWKETVSTLRPDRKQEISIKIYPLTLNSLPKSTYQHMQSLGKHLDRWSVGKVEGYVCVCVCLCVCVTN